MGYLRARAGLRLPGPGRGWRLRVAATAAMIVFGCAGDEFDPVGNPVLIIEGTDPAVVVRGSTDVEVDVLGLGFVEGRRFCGTRRLLRPSTSARAF